MLELPLADLGHRLLASVIDVIVLIIYSVLANIAFISFWQIKILDSFSFLTFLFLFLPVTFYIPVCEYFWGGKTIGKHIMKLRVMKNDGSAASMGDIVLRWLLRPIDLKIGLLFFFFIPESSESATVEYISELVMIFTVVPLPVVGIISVLVSKRNQRLGDIVANTVVIRNTRTVSLKDTILKKTEVDYQPVFTNVLDLSDRDIYIIKSVLDSHKNTKNKKVVNDLAIKAREILSINQEMDSIKLLRTLAKDYNYLAKKKDEVES